MILGDSAHPCAHFPSLVLNQSCLQSLKLKMALEVGTAVAQCFGQCVFCFIFPVQPTRRHGRSVNPFFYRIPS